MCVCVCVCARARAHNYVCVGQESKPITVTLPDGKTVSGHSWKTTSYDVACGISKGLADNTVVAKVHVYICIPHR